MKSFVTLPTSLVLLLLAAILMMMGCASGTTKTDPAWKFPDEDISAVKTNCTTTFPEATSGKFEDLWANKRAILKQARNCANAANTLADEAGNRNKVIGK